MYELFEHTADLGLRIRATSLTALFEDAARCLVCAMVDNPEAIQPLQSDTVAIAGTDREYLLFDWLRELLLRMEDQQTLYSAFEVEILPEGLQAKIAGEPIDPDRHHLSREVKAITYHELKVVRDGEDWLAEVIVDI
jgi:SHS2 domain-containing protein